MNEWWFSGGAFLPERGRSVTRIERSIAAKERRIKRLRREVAELQARYLLLRQRQAKLMAQRTGNIWR